MAFILEVTLALMDVSSRCVLHILMQAHMSVHEKFGCSKEATVKIVVAKIVCFFFFLSVCILKDKPEFTSRCDIFYEVRVHFHFNESEITSSPTSFQKVWSGQECHSKSGKGWVESQERVTNSDAQSHPLFCPRPTFQLEALKE